MRHAVRALAAGLLLATAAQAQGPAKAPSQHDRPMECAWLKIGAATKAAGGARLSNAALASAMQSCGVPANPGSAQKMGLYNKVRSKLATTGPLLQSKHGFTAARLDGLVAPLTPQDRAAIVGLAKKPAMPAILRQHLRQALATSGIPPADRSQQRLAAEYILARVMVDELNR